MKLEDREHIIMIIDNMQDHLKEIKIQVESNKIEGANQYIDGIVNAANDLESSLNILLNKIYENFKKTHRE